MKYVQNTTFQRKLIQNAESKRNEIFNSLQYMSETILTFKHFISSNNFSFLVFSSSASVLSWLKTLIASSSIDGLSVLTGLPGSKTALRSQNLQKSQPNSSLLSLKEAAKHNTKQKEFIVT